MKTVVLIIIVLAIVYVLYSIERGRKLIYTCSHPKKITALSIETIPFEVEKFQFHSSDGLTLQGILYKPQQKARGTILCCHYLGGSKYSIYTYIQPLLYKGFQVASFDYPNHGESMSRLGNRFTLEEDMRRFIDTLKEKRVQGPYGTMGFSMGATIAFGAIDYFPEIKAIMVDSGPLIFVRDYFKYVLRIHKEKNLITKAVFLFGYLHIIGFYSMSKKMMARMQQLKNYPILMVHSRTDKVIPYKNAEYIHNCLNGEQAKLITVDKAYHLTNRIVLGDKYDDMTAAFFERWLKSDE